MTSDDEFRFLFNDCNESKGSDDGLVYETGFRQSLLNITLLHKEVLKTTLREYNAIIKTKAEIDQFSQGLEQLGVLKCIQKHKNLIAPLFVHQPNVLNKGEILNVIHFV